MVKMVESMVKGIGQSRIEALLTWFPGSTKEELITEVNKSDILELNGNIVYLKNSPKGDMKNVVEKELSFLNASKTSKDRLRSTLSMKDPNTPPSDNSLNEDFTKFDDPIDTQDIDAVDVNYTEILSKEIDEIISPEIDYNNIDLNENDLSLNLEDLETSTDEDELSFEYINLDDLDIPDVKATSNDNSSTNETKEEDTVDSLNYCSLMKMIYHYNKSVQENYTKLATNSYDNFITAIKNYYTNKYDVVEREGSFEEVLIFSLLHKKNKLEVAKLLICQNLSQDIVGFLEANLSFDTVYICPYNLFGEAPKFKNYEFYIKNTEEILKEYIEGFKLVSEDCTLLKLSRK